MKRFTSIALLVGLFTISLLIARPALTDQQSDKKNSDQATLEELQKERIETLQEVVTMLSHQYRSGTVDFRAVRNAHEELVEAKMDSTSKPDERIALLKGLLKSADDIWKLSDARFKAL